MKRKALLIGAGFSYDLGMPLAKGFTKDLFHYLSPDKIRYFMEIWKKSNPYGKGRSIDPSVMDEVLEMFMTHKSNEEANYEGFLKEIQMLHNKPGTTQSRRDTLHFAFGRFFDLIIQMFWMYQVNNYDWYVSNKEYYKSFSSFVSDNVETWIISLNHDLFIEFLSFELGIPLSFGSEKKVEFPINNLNYQQKITFNFVERENLELSRMNFFKDKRGINLLKLHGGINEFSYDNDSKVLHLSINDCDTPLTYLSKTDTVLHRMNYLINGQEVKIGGEIAVSDLNGEMQFLRHSILTGGYKYSETFDPKPGEEKIQLMEEILSKVDELTIVGYGFGDIHVNQRLYNAMLLNKDLSIMIVDPYISAKPEFLKPFDYKFRIKTVRAGVAEFFSYMENQMWDKKLSDGLMSKRDKRGRYDEEFRKWFLSTKIKK
jgi:hypothetical protein